MAKGLTKIDKIIEKASIPFLEYIKENFESEIYEILIGLTHKTNVYIFSGVIRNYFLGINENRDLDLVVDTDFDIHTFFNGYEIKRNSFGGFKISIKSLSLDLWYIKDTWAYKQKGTLNFDLHKNIPETTFFNFSSVIYSVNEKKFFYSSAFTSFLKNRVIDLVYEQNPNYALCVVNSLYYSEKFKLKLSRRLKSFLIFIHNKYDFNYDETQLKHFGKVLFTNNVIRIRVVNWESEESPYEFEGAYKTEDIDEASYKEEAERSNEEFEIDEENDFDEESL